MSAKANIITALRASNVAQLNLLTMVDVTDTALLRSVGVNAELQRAAIATERQLRAIKAAQAALQPKK